MEKINKEMIKDIIEWDVETWKAALYFWDNILPERLTGKKALEIGARNGGLSLYLALKDCNVICSDIDEVTDKAKYLHKKYKVENLISYDKIDAAKTFLFPDNYFDIVVFKSVLGAIGRNNNKPAQQRAINEIWRVLKPGGLLLFAENLVGSSIHKFLRKKFVPWGNSWRYISIEEMKEFTSCFSSLVYSTTGFFAALGRSERQRKLLHILDIFTNPIIEQSNKYVIYGVAKK